MRPEVEPLVRGRGARPILLAASAGLLASAIASVLYPPLPIAHDEFAYLLAADTFARGRLANPTPPAWEALETMHVLMQPAYGAKYPPGQGLVLALGLVLGAPLLGVWVASGFAAGAVAWMLAAWVRRPWATVGALLFALHPVVALGWGASYWGGALACAGAALAWGAAPRVVLRGSRGAGAALGVGVGLLALSRPFEGLVALAPLAVLLALALLRRRVPARARPARALGPALLALAPCALLVGLHARAQTGSFLRLPYQEHYERHEVVPVWLCASPREEPAYRHEVLRTFYTRSSAREFRARQSAEGFLAGMGEKVELYGGSFAGAAWPLLLVGLLVRRRDARVRVLAAASLLAVLALALETFELTHYAAPFVPAALALWLAGADRLWGLWRGRLVVRTLVVLVLLAGWLPVAARARELAERRAASPLVRRPALQGELIELAAERGRRALVFVRYAPEHNPHVEWVHNGADPARAPLVWARSRGEEEDRAVLAAYPGRIAWLLEPDREPLAPRPYLRED